MLGISFTLIKLLKSAPICLVLNLFLLEMPFINEYISVYLINANAGISKRNLLLKR